MCPALSTMRCSISCNGETRVCVAAPVCVSRFAILRSVSGLWVRAALSIAWPTRIRCAGSRDLECISGSNWTNAPESGPDEVEANEALGLKSWWGLPVDSENIGLHK